MVQAGNRLGLGPKAGEQGRVRVWSGQEHLQGDNPVE
jgi:hypothetical protein